MRKAPNHRITSLKVRCADCLTTKLEDVVPDKVYSVATASYLANGGDGFKMVSEQKLDHFVGEWCIFGILRGNGSTRLDKM